MTVDMVAFNSGIGRKRFGFGNSESAFPLRSLLLVAVTCMVVFVAGCSAINLGRVLWIDWPERGDKYYLLKEAFLSSGGPDAAKRSFDHQMNPVVNLFFSLRNETNRYVVRSVWIDPYGQEYRTIRRTYAIDKESKKSIDRRPQTGSTMRVHSITTEELYQRKPGLWKVALLIDGELARRFEFTVR